MDWLEFDLGVAVDGETIDLAPPIVALIGAEGFDPSGFEGRGDDAEPFYLRLADGRFLALPVSRWVEFVPSANLGDVWVRTLDNLGNVGPRWNDVTFAKNRHSLYCFLSRDGTQ